MDYSQYKQLEFRRKFFQLFSPTITVFTGGSNTVVGFIKMKAFAFRNDIRLYTDTSMTQEVVLIKARSFVRLNMAYDVTNSQTNQVLFTLQHRGLRSVFKRDHWDLFDAQGNKFGAVDETSGALAIARRWLIIVPYVGPYLELILDFTPQTFDITDTRVPSTKAIIGKIVHRKNPFLVRMGLDTSMAQAAYDPHIGIAATTLLAVLDASKRS
jgi:hypothetical protein